MSTLKVFLLILLFSSPAWTMNESEINPQESTTIDVLREKLYSISFPKDESSFSMEIQFMMNTEDEIIILSTAHHKYDQLIKSKLNYCKIKDNDLERMKVYILPVKVE